MKPRIRDNFGRFEKYATINITKHLQEVADQYSRDLSNIVAEKLEETYKKNVEASYTPRTTRGQEIAEYNKKAKELDEKSGNRSHRKKLTYHHTGIFLNSIYTITEDNVVKIMIRDDKYPNGTSATQVYKWLTEGTMGGDKPYSYIKQDGSIGWSRNFATPAHLFEEHTRLQIKGFLDSLESEIKNGTYKSRKYHKKK